MADEHRDLPPLHFGDYPNGAYWSALPPEGDSEAAASEEEDFRYEGRSLRIMWDEEAGPLWGDLGLLSDEPEWMQRALGMSDPLIADLLAWMHDMTTFWRGPSYNGWEDDDQVLQSRGHQLAERLQHEMGPGVRVWHDA